MANDYYETLGVGRDADEKALRRAYRNMAKTHHPDLNDGDPKSDARFKAINEAYDVLRDPRKRAIYDRYGHAGLKSAGQGGGATATDFGDLGDIFEQFFGFGGRRGGQQRDAAQRGGNLRTRINLSFEEAVFGVTRQIEILRRERCETCTSSGAKPGTGPSACGTCKGTGEVRHVQQSVFGSFVNVQACSTCGGRGQVIQNPCEDCRGQGLKQQSRTLEVDVPGGVEDGVQIRLNGEGDHGRFNGPAGDLYVVLKVAEHPMFVREEIDLHVELRLNPADAALGATLEVPTLEEPVSLDIPPGTQTGDTFVIEGSGVPHLRRAGRGDLVVTAYVMTPEGLSPEQKELMEQLRALLPDSGVVERDNERGGFWQRIRNRFA